MRIIYLIRIKYIQIIHWKSFVTILLHKWICKDSGLYVKSYAFKTNRDRWCKVGTLQQHEIVRRLNWRTCNGIIALSLSTGVVVNIVKLKGRPLLPVSFRDTKLLVLINTASTQIAWRQQSMKNLRNEIREWLLIFC